MKTLPAIEAKIKKFTRERESLWAQIVPLENRVRDLHSKLQALKDERDTLILASKKKKSDWEWMFRECSSGDVSMLLFRFFKEQLQKQFGMSTNGQWCDTEEREISICMDRNDKDCFEKTLKGIRTLTPLMKPHTDGKVWFSILSKGSEGRDRLYLGPGPHATVGGDFDLTGHSFDSVEDALRYIEKNLWYDWY